MNMTELSLWLVAGDQRMALASASELDKIGSMGFQTEATAVVVTRLVGVLQMMRHQAEPALTTRDLFDDSPQHAQV